MQDVPVHDTRHPDYEQWLAAHWTRDQALERLFRLIGSQVERCEAFMEAHRSRSNQLPLWSVKVDTLWLAAAAKELAQRLGGGGS